MKLKDIIAGNFYWTRSTRYEAPRPVRVVELIDEPTGASWTHHSDLKNRPTMKKVRCVELRMMDNGKLVEQNMYRPLTPQGFARPTTLEDISAFLCRENIRVADSRRRRKTVEENMDRFIDALTEAGFPGAADGHGKVTFNNYAISNWAISNPAEKEG